MCKIFLSLQELDVAQAALLAAADGLYFDENDLSCLTGRTREELRRFATRLLTEQEIDEATVLAISSVLNNLLRFPHRKGELLESAIPGGIAALSQLECRFDELRPTLPFTQIANSPPAAMEGRIYRVVQYHRDGGGSGQSTQIWLDGNWKISNAGPGVAKVLAATKLSADECAKLGIDCSAIGELF